MTGRPLIVSAAGLLVSALSVGQGAAQTCTQQVRDLVEMLDSSKTAVEGQRSDAKVEDKSPLIVTMADGTEVDLRDDAPVARPFENWFGDPIKRKEMEGRIVEAQSLAEAEKDESCIVEIGKLREKLGVQSAPN